MRVSIDEYEKLFNSEFPFLFGGTFIEGIEWGFITQSGRWDFPSFSEGLSLRANHYGTTKAGLNISLPFRRDFH